MQKTRTIFHWKRIFSSMVIFVKALCYIFIALSLAVCVRMFVGELFKVPSASMEDSILTDDVIWVDKMSLGAVLPNRLNEIPFIGGLFEDSSRCWDRKFLRMWGWGEITHNDVIVFSNPNTSLKKKLVKRCIGLPGDLVGIQNDSVYINSKVLPDKPGYRFEFYCKNDSANSRKLAESGIKVHKFTIQSTDFVRFDLSVQNAERLTRFGIRLKHYNFGQGFEISFPASKRKIWSYQNYGDFLIPSKNLRLMLTNENFLVYRETINKFEPKKIARDNDRFYVDGQAATSFTFSKNYYFVLGDNRLNAIDSRDFGLIPEELIDGKAKFVLFNKRKSRTFKKI